MRIIQITLFILLSFKLSSQEIIEFKKGEFTFYLSKDCKELYCEISEINIFKNGQAFQKIIPSENSFYSFMNNETIMEIEDMNFDNLIDFRILKEMPSEYPDPYLYWIYNDKMKIFEANTSYEIIISPKFDYQNKIIISSWSGYLSDFYKGYYKIIDGVPNLFEKSATKLDKNGIYQVETWKVIDGELKLINTINK